MTNPIKKLDAKVAFFTGYIPPYALPVFQELDRRVSDLTIFLSTPMEGNRHWDAEWGDLNVVVQNTITHASKWKHRIGFQDKKETHIPWDTLRQLRKLRPDIIVSEELGYRSLLCSLYKLLHRRTPLVLVCNLSEHTEKDRGFMRSLLRKWLSKSATVTTANGKSGLRYLSKSGFPEDSLHWFPYTSKPGIFETLPLERPSEPTVRLIYVGELSTRKGILRFAQELAEWCKKNPQTPVSLAVYGTGADVSELESIARTPGLHLELLGHRNYDEVCRGMAQASMLVFPTLADEWGLVVNEGLAAGLPVMGSKFSQAAEELIAEGRNGWLFDPTKPEEIQDMLDRVLTLPQAEINGMRGECRSSVAERTPDWAAEKLANALQAAFDSRKVK